MSDWQPISTAPKDGTCVILWVVEDHDGKGHMLWPCMMLHGDWCWEISDNRNLDYDYEIIERCKPTHWMPLPQPPEDALMDDVRQRLSYDAETFHDQGAWDREDACLAIMKRIDLHRARRQG